ncbi:MAG TPA: LysR family transcriptional regulator [Porticoccus sp.]|nr:LysR family transcriptional regulator [Porticoccus sp.]
MDMRQLKHLVALVETGTMHAAAEDQYISQPGLSSSIKRLESELGISLFEREGRGMTPNVRGQGLYQHAKLILMQLRLARVELNDTQSKIIIGLGDVRASNFIANLTERLQQQFPNLALEFFESDYETLYEQLENGGVDAAFVGTPDDHIHNIPSSLISSTLFHSGFGVFCSSDHPLARNTKKVSIAELESWPWMVNTSAPAITPILPYFKNKKTLSEADVDFIRVDSLHMGKELVICSNCLCHLPELAVAVEVKQGKLVRLDLALRAINITIAGLRRSNVHSRVLDQAFAIVEDYFKGSVTE